MKQNLKTKVRNLLKSSASFKVVMALTLVTAIFTETIFTLFYSFDLLNSISRVIIVFLSLTIFQNYAQRSMVNFRPSLKDLILLNTILLGSIAILWFGKIVTIALSDYLTQFAMFSFVTPETLHYAIPFACGGLLIAAVKGLVFGLVLAVCFSVIVGFYLPESFIIIPYVLVTTLIACRSLESLRNRSSYLRAALEIGLITIPFSLVTMTFADQFVPIDLLLRVITPIVGGLLAVAIAAALTPLLEHVGSYVTDLRLIEMSTLDHPLLRELSIQTPGTWNHSMVLGMMVEAGANEIGANSVLSRVGAYFHDIGKTKKPLYFIENQSGENRHERLSPSMSALIIRSHVKDGVEMAKEHRLPEAIIDLIKQHHGTSLIEYFYRKAVTEAEAADETVEVDKSLYTYPGPKPQTREAGILMLADVIESSARARKDLSVDRIQQHVQTMINKIFSSGQLDECDLTLRDLHKIARSFSRVLTGIHHQRIAYEPQQDKNQDKQKDTENQKLAKESGLQQDEKANHGSKDETQSEVAGRSGKQPPQVAKDSASQSPERKKTNKQSGKQKTNKSKAQPKDKSESAPPVTHESENQSDKKPAKDADKNDLKRLGVGDYS